MRQMIVLAGMLIGMGVVAARVADQTVRTPVAPPAAAALPTAAELAVAPAAQNSYGSSVVVPHDARGHFMVDARVDGRHMTFMLDTGASVVALRARDAASLGIHPVAREFTVEVQTANGSVRAAPVQLGMVEVNGLNVRNVAALVSPDEGLSE